MFINFLLAGSIGDRMDVIFHGLDMAVFHFFGSMQSDFLTEIVKVFTAMGSTKYITLMAIMGLVMCFFKRTRKVGFALVFAVLIGTLITNVVVKPTFLRVRPYNTLQGDAQYWAWYLGAGRLCEPDYSFPSGHTTGAFELGTALFLCHFTEKKKGVAWIFPVIATLTAASRIYLMVHYATDVFAGMIVGTVAGIAGYLISKRLSSLISGKQKDSIIDLGRWLNKENSKVRGALMIAAAWLLIFGFSYFTSLHHGGDEIVRCAYHREYDCQNAAQVHSKQYPAINGEYYCTIHWKQLNEEFQQKESGEEPVKALISRVFEAFWGIQIGEETEAVPDVDWAGFGQASEDAA